MFQKRFIVDRTDGYQVDDPGQVKIIDTGLQPGKRGEIHIVTRKGHVYIGSFVVGTLGAEAFPGRVARSGGAQAPLIRL
ncbi:MAG: hypothetical protein A2Z99_06595 [Treponema sp. GWB1_62_6]|nr:MAG: hypothetical protein A2001_10900 [Treponema sp. GWC1_61_84]OHE68044.1 MAG: hypothetical protein A2Z99_06595 [Treponema sp. GWB1_62_6]OHE68931.1 MAG: hypothetical protein A2413_07815 [Treponema sp. RIFOXYC1_FULL_61_9]